MKLTELRKEKGTYAAVNFSKVSQAALLKFAKTIKVPEPLARSKLHSTLLYSRRHCPNYVAQGVIDPPMIATVKDYDVFRTPNSDKRCLVLKLDCLELVKRHLFLMNEHSATYDFLQYIPHVTLSYNIGEEFDVLTLPPFTERLEIVEEVGSDLELD